MEAMRHPFSAFYPFTPLLEQAKKTELLMEIVMKGGRIKL